MIRKEEGIGEAECRRKLDVSHEYFICGSTRPYCRFNITSD